MKPNVPTFERSNVHTIIEASGLHKSFAKTHAVNGVSLRVAAGEIYGLVGSDGAGKTTTLRLIVGALRADAGQVHVGGVDVLKDPESARAQIGYLSQRFSLYEDLTVLENIRFFAEVRGLPPAEWLQRCNEILEFVGLANFSERRAGQLSGGMKQKLGLASALVTRPRVLLLDEPTTGVDPVTRQDFWQLLIRLVATPLSSSAQARGGDGGRNGKERRGEVAVLISTPYMDEASRCNRIGFMKQGRMIAEGTPSQLRERLAGRVLELRGKPIKLLRHHAHQDGDVEDVQAFGDRLHLRVRENKTEEVTGRLPARIRAAGGELDDLRSIPAGLEDVFIELSEDRDPSPEGVE